MLPLHPVSRDAASPAPPTACPGISDCRPLIVRDDSAYERPWDADAMLRDVNVVRWRAGLAPVEMDPQLSDLAHAHAVDMIAKRYFAHESPDGRSPFNRMHDAHVTYRYAGENLALNYDQVHASLALWHSRTHRDNILNAHFTRVGIVAIETNGGGELFVEDFTD